LNAYIIAKAPDLACWSYFGGGGERESFSADSDITQTPEIETPNWKAD
jgi:hypothetical protein